MARYLVTGQSVTSGIPMPPEQARPFMESIVFPTFETLLRWEQEGRIEAGGLFAGGRGGAFIVDASSHEELNEMLQSLPVWPLAEWTVTPLQTFGDRFEQDKQYVARMAG